MKRALFLQYTNPAGYPPLQNASRLMVEAGWKALFLGRHLPEVAELTFPPLNRRKVRMMPFLGQGLAGKLSYLAYIAWSAATALIWRPNVIYASDPTSCLPAMAARAMSGSRVVYHEHDSPEREGPPRDTLDKLSRRLARQATVCIAPQAERLARLVEAADRQGPSICVWNCPMTDEVMETRPPRQARPLTFYYHGSINAARLPLALLDAMAALPGAPRLVFAGYEPGQGGYVAKFLARADELGLGVQVAYRGAVPTREDLFALAADCDIGLAFMPMTGGDLNMRRMAGASNKAFDYMAAGMMLLVSDLPDWTELFVEPGFAIACNLDEPHSLARRMMWCGSHPKEVREAGERGRRKIKSDWNYEVQFAPVMALIERSPSP